MIGAIIGDIVGSRFERSNIKTKDFKLFTPFCRPTDDSVMSLAVAKAILECNGSYEGLGGKAIEWMRRLGRKYSYAGYGGKFRGWLLAENPKPYGSFGNGAAMRVSACGFAARSMDEAKALSRAVTEVSHNHPESLKAAEAIACAVFMGMHGEDMLAIRNFVMNRYYAIGFRLDDIRESYAFDVSCQGSVPQAFEAFFESTGFEDAIRNAVSIGGDSDTIAAITRGMAEARYGVPSDLHQKALGFLPDDLTCILTEFEERYPAKVSSAS